MEVLGGPVSGLWFTPWTVLNPEYRSCRWQASSPASSRLSCVSSEQKVWEVFFMPNCIYFTFVYMTWTPYLTCFCLIFRCKGSIFWSDSHNDPYISSQRCSVLGLWNQPQNHDGTVWKLTLWQHTFFSGWIWLSFLNELALIHHWPVYSISVNMPWFAHTNAHFYNDALLGFIYLLTLYSKVILV